MRRTAIHVAETSRTGPLTFTSSSSNSSSSRYLRCPTPFCRSPTTSQPRAFVSSRQASSSAGSSSCSSRLPREDEVPLSLSRHARDLHSTARAQAQVQNQYVFESGYDQHDQLGSWAFPYPESIPQPSSPFPIRNDRPPHQTKKQGKGRSSDPVLDLRLAEAPDDWLIGEDYDLTPPFSISDLALEDTPIIYEDDLPLPPSHLDTYDPTVPPSTSKRRRRRIAKSLAPMPPLPAGEMPEDGLSRFDWRETTLSAKDVPSKEQVGKGRLWYPDLARIRRRKAEKVLLSKGDTFHDEIKRYVNQYVHLSPHPIRVLKQCCGWKS